MQLFVLIIKWPKGFFCECVCVCVGGGGLRWPYTRQQAKFRRTTVLHATCCLVYSYFQLCQYFLYKMIMNRQNILKPNYIVQFHAMICMYAHSVTLIPVILNTYVYYYKYGYLVNHFSYSGFISDISECLPNGGLGPCAHICTNTIGSFQCSCQPGYALSGDACNSEKTFS